jgi:hypothetical protein
MLAEPRSICFTTTETRVTQPDDLAVSIRDGELLVIPRPAAGLTGAAIFGTIEPHVADEAAGIAPSEGSSRSTNTRLSPQRPAQRVTPLTTGAPQPHGRQQIPTSVRISPAEAMRGTHASNYPKLSDDEDVAGVGSDRN